MTHTPPTTKRARSRATRGSAEVDDAGARTTGTLLDRAESRILGSRAIDHWERGAARSDAEQLLAEAMGIDSRDLVADDTVRAVPRRRFVAMVDRRVAGEPIALIVGHTEFRGLDLLTRHGVFSPRGSSELLAEDVIRRMRRRRGGVCVDVATGAGPVALSVASEVPTAEVWGVDISREAVSLCRRNARRLGLNNAHFATGDMLGALPARYQGRIEVFAIHPPYVAAHEVAHLPREIRKFEPAHTLTDRSADGLGLVRRLAAEAPDWLTRNGRVHVEIGPSLSRSCQAIFRRAGFADVAWVRDAGGLTRVVIAGRPAL